MTDPGRNLPLFIIGGSCHKYHRGDKTFVAAIDVFCRDKHVFVETNMILVAAPANDIYEGLVMLLKILREEPSRCIKTSPMLPKVLRKETSRYSRTSPM